MGSRRLTPDPRARAGGRRPARAALPLVLLGALLGLGAGTLVHQTVPAEQEATVTLELSAVSPLLDLGPSALSGRPVAVDTDAQILLSDEIVGPVAEASGRTPDEVRTGLVASARPLTRVLDLHYRTPGTEASLAGAARAAETFLELRQRLVIQPTLDFLEGVADSPLNTTEESDEPLVDLDGDLSQGELSQEDRAAALALELPSPGTVLQAPRITAADDRGDPEVPLASGAALGALLGLLLWWSRNRRRPGPDGPHPSGALAPRQAAGPRRRGAWRYPALAAGLFALVGAGAGAALAPELAPGADAEASVLVTPLPGAAFADRNGNALVDLGTEAQLALSDAVLERVAAPRGQDPVALRQRLSVRLVPNAEVVVVHARDGAGERAASLVERVAQATLDERKQRAADTLATRSDLLGARISRTELDVERAARAEDLDATEVLSGRLVKLREDLKTLASGAQAPGSVLGTARVVPAAATAVKIGLPVLGLLAGAASGWLLSLWLRARRRRRPADPLPVVPAVRDQQEAHAGTS